MVKVLIGLQWGDEGKGKFVDYLSKNIDWVIRYAGGANAGHSIVHGTKKFAFHLLPTGILNPNTKVLLGPAMVIDPEGLQKELKNLDDSNIDWKGRIFISDRAHLVLPSYKIEDEKMEAQRKKQIGTTKKGIGIAYSKKALRTGIRIADIDDLENSEINNKDDLEFINTYKSFLKDLAINHIECLENIKDTHKILYEGAQGVMLDIDIGTYPYVTSGPTALNGVYTCGVPSKNIDEVLGIVKIYATRVGAGPFPSEFTEEEKELREFIQKEGNEIGTTTGRLRRCGHLDLPALKFAASVSGTTTLAITHLDVLDSLSHIKICTAYNIGDKTYTYLPTSLKEQLSLTPQLTTFEGWNTSTSQCKTWNELPEKAKEFLKFIEEYIGIPIKLLSVGADREQTIIKDNYLHNWIQ